MEDSPLAKPDLPSSQQAKADTQASRKRKVAQKTVVTVKIETNNTGKQKGEGPPSDPWSWRKYGQKPIKGSPYPRGYYRCSTSKGCSAKKQVERCRTDPSVLVVTYTSDHNHSDPDPPNTTNPSTTPATTILHSRPTTEQGVPTTDNTEEPTRVAASACKEDPTAGRGDPQLQPPPKCLEENAPQDSTTMGTDETHSLLSTSIDQGGALPYPNGDNSSVQPAKSTEDNFFDELEELPVSSSFTGWVRSSSFDDRVFTPLPVPLQDY